jgi:hypothetical protein
MPAKWMNLRMIKDVLRLKLEAHLSNEVANGMDAPTRNGINVPQWKCVSTTRTEGGVHHED